ncbi:HAD-IIIA family hydrolase [Alkalihalobacillus pseudalcaliphilus]|uniref:HAD-IIIA family hydrolase n=1 Tax=Alkalihalobacillus pseudalcaliphilus TaxID=79884 RepID=UPI00064DB50F|nr:HAD-IIIA family hydrolase [Alkalihalobacillus pseudalcaliphilus]KMK76821.1 hypothetical protein AB990_07905 [Alkalihalobacillus pseudalcaliphilus]
MNLQAVFIDRDGTIGGTGHFVHPNDFKPYSFSMEAIELLKKKGIPVFALTNQHRISKGQASIHDFEEEFEKLGFDDAFICPHPMDGHCTCHKPKPGLLHHAAEKYQLDLSQTAVIGDVGSTDMLAAEEVGALKILVKTGWGQSSLDDFRDSWSTVDVDYIAENLLSAVHWLLK